MADKNTHSITPEQLVEREREGVCPRCNSPLAWMKPKDDGDGNYRGGFWVCSRHRFGWADHYQLSPGGGTRNAKPRETVGVTPAWTPNTRSSGPRVGSGVVRGRGIARVEIVRVKVPA